MAIVVKWETTISGGTAIVVKWETIISGGTVRIVKPETAVSEVRDLTGRVTRLSLGIVDEKLLNNLRKARVVMADDQGFCDIISCRTFFRKLET